MTKNVPYRRRHVCIAWRWCAALPGC